MNMKLYALAAAAALSTAVQAATPLLDDSQLQRLATCQESWLDWKDDARRMDALAEALQARFTRQADGAAFKPKVPAQMLGGRVLQLFPQSVGMGVGFSVELDAGLAPLRQRLEKQLGRPLDCQAGEGLMSCGAELGPKKTLMLMSGEDGRARTSLLGCYYFYAP